jgi:hypothetical protein
MSLESLLAGIREIRGPVSGKVSLPPVALPSIGLSRRGFLRSAGFLAAGAGLMAASFAVRGYLFRPQEYDFLPDGFKDLYLGMGEEELKGYRQGAEIDGKGIIPSSGKKIEVSVIREKFSEEERKEILNFLFNNNQNYISQLLSCWEEDPSSHFFQGIYRFEDDKLRKIEFNYTHRRFRDHMNYLIFRKGAPLARKSLGMEDKLSSRRGQWTESYDKEDPSSTLIGDATMLWNRKNFQAELIFENGMIGGSVLCYRLSSSEGEDTR